jgi:hypothetical protein
MKRDDDKNTIASPIRTTTYFDRYVSNHGLDGKRSRLDVDITEVDLECRDGDDDFLHLERLAELGQTDFHFS